MGFNPHKPTTLDTPVPVEGICTKRPNGQFGIVYNRLFGSKLKCQSGLL